MGRGPSKLRMNPSRLPSLLRASRVNVKPAPNIRDAQEAVWQDWLVTDIRYKLSSVKRFYPSIFALAGVVALLCAVVESLAQSEANSNPLKDGVVLTKLFPPVYPRLALQAHIAGDLELILDIRPNGSVASAIAVSGPPLLKQAALESAQQSQFECKNCSEEVHSYRLWYTFRLDPTDYCAQISDVSNAKQPEKLYPRVTQSQDHVTVVEQAVRTCDRGKQSFESAQRNAFTSGDAELPAMMNNGPAQACALGSLGTGVAGNAPKLRLKVKLAPIGGCAFLRNGKAIGG